jgi:dipeptidyl aminopeptidase/acylaminoacyl peptidase
MRPRFSSRQPSFLIALAASLAAVPSVASAQAHATTTSGQGDPHGSMWVGGHGSANWDLAARWAPYQQSDLTYSMAVSPNWIEGGEKFWYEWENRDGSVYYIVDPAQGTQRPIFDNDRLAAELTRITRDPWDGQHLPIRSIRFIDENTLQFDVQSSQDEEEEEAEVEEDMEEEEDRGRERQRPKKRVFHFEFDIPSQTLRLLEGYEAPNNHPGWASVSPDGQTVVFARNHDLYMMTAAEYARILDVRRDKSGEEADSLDQELEVEEIRLTEDGEPYYSWAANSSGRGILDSEKEEEWGERNRAAISWSRDSRRFATVRSDQREVDMLWVIHNTGHERPELESYKYDMPGESNVTQQELWWYDLDARAASQVDDDPWKDQSMALLNAPVFFYRDSTEPRRSLWASEDPNELWFTRRSRDRHRLDLVVADLDAGTVRVVIEERLNTYLEEMQRPQPRLLASGEILWWSEEDGYGHLYLYGADGTLRQRLTEGPWTIGSSVEVDEDRGVVIFNATGREEGMDPYYFQFYRVGLDGSGLRRLTPENYDNQASLSESGRFMVHTFSRVNAVPESVVRNAGGEVVMDLQVADVSRLVEAGWQMPEPFTVKAGDGVTDLYGVMYKPHPSRSKWYHNYGYGNLRDYGLEDKKVTVEQLAQRHDFIDMDRVGIYGHSGGGFMSTAAMLVYPDFFKVAVSSSGNHTNDIYNRWWSETHHGVKEIVEGDSVRFEYDIAKNPDLAKNLKGELMLTTGDRDNNVHHANTVRMAEALIRANKRFDYFIFPGQRHGYGDMSDYWFWLRSEYFVRHLLGDDRKRADITELNLERQQTR